MRSSENDGQIQDSFRYLLVLRLEIILKNKPYMVVVKDFHL
jgi:hypothetical protein